MIKDILDKYNLEYSINNGIIDIWRNGKYFQLNSNINDELLFEVILDELCIASPISVKKAKIDFPQYFELPKVGDYIAVRDNNSSLSGNSYKQFKEFRGNKIICFSKSGKEERTYDYFQQVFGDSFPSTTFWMNSHFNIVPWLVIERLNTY